MEQHDCLGCERTLAEDNGRLIGLVLTDDRGQETEIIGAWCDEKCLGGWLVKSAVESFVQKIVRPSKN